MIDNIKFYINDKDRFQRYLEENQIGSLSSIFDRETGELMNYPLTGKLKNMKIKITEKKAYVLGSIHKYYNLINPEKLEGNFNQFTFCEFKVAVDHLCSQLFIDPEDVKITNLEFGFNIGTSQSPKDLIEKHILMFDYKEHNRNHKFRGKGSFKEFEMTDYSLKLYDKSLQYGKPSQKVLRVEQKITNSRYLNKLGIFNLNDINKHTLNSIYVRLYKNFAKLVIVDVTDPPSNLRLDRKVLYVNGLNPNYWVLEKEKLGLSRLKKDFERIISEFELNTLKYQLMDSIRNKYHNLLYCDDLEKVS